MKLFGKAEPDDGKPRAPAKEKPRRRIRERDGISVLILLICLFLGGAAGQYVYTSAGIGRNIQSINTDRARIVETQNIRFQLKFYEDRKSKIERNHQVYSSGRNGPARREDLSPFPEYGFEKFEMRKNRAANQPGVLISGNKTEFQRVCAGISKIEASYPLLQITKIKMALPDGIPPMSENPTYLNSEIEFFSPRL